MVVDTKSVTSYLRSGWISKLFFWWITPVLYKGSKADLHLGDLDPIPSSDEASALGAALSKSWAAELDKSNSSYSKDKNKNNEPSLTSAVWRTFGTSYMLLGGLVFLNECCIQFQPILLGCLIQYFTNPAQFEMSTGLWFATGVILCTLLLTVIHHTFAFQVMRAGMKVRVACSSLIYTKSLKLTRTSIVETKVGQIVNLLGNDLNRVDQLSFSFHYLWVAPVQAAMVTVILWHYLGPSSLIGLALIILYIPMQLCYGRWFSMLRSETAGKTDGRMGLVTEIVNGIRTIKLNSWETLFLHKVEKWREEELKVVKRTGALRALNGTLFGLSSKIVIFATIITHFLSGGELTPEKVFVSLALYNNIKYIMTLCFPMAITQLAETIVTFRRIQNFLLKDEVSSNYKQKGLKSTKKGPRIFVKELDVHWTKDKDNDSVGVGLSGMNFSTDTTNEFIGVMGPVGSGKSSLLNALLGESRTSGTLEVEGSVSYASQDPWIFAGSVRENIVLGKEFRQEWYDQVVKACALAKDFELLPKGDRTLVGELGVALSGGQKSRINLARAVYSDPDIILMDDPFASLDSKVGQHIFEHCVQGLLRNKIRVLVTHHTHFLLEADKLLIVGEGNVDLVTVEQLKNTENQMDLNCYDRIEEVTNTEDTAYLDKQEETEVKGKRVNIWEYFGRLGYFRCTLLILVPNLLCIGLLVVSDFWLKIISTSGANSKEEQLDQNETLFVHLEIFEYFRDTDEGKLFVYSGIMVLLLIIYLGRSLAFYRICLRISAILHKSLLSAVLSTPTRFFEHTPTGRILSRFGNDMGILDELLPQTMFDTMEILQNLVAILIVVSIVVPLSLISVLILLIPILLLRKFYLKCSKSVKRLEGAARGPILSHLNTTISGISYIRCTPGLDNRLTKEFHNLLDHHSSSWFVYLASARWISMWMDLLSLIFMACVTFSFFLVTPEGDTASSFGLVISSMMALTGMLQWGVRQSAEVENQLVSLERVSQYSEGSLEVEGGERTNTNFSLITPDWPFSGEVVLSRMSLRYSEESPYVLHDINLHFHPGEKIGIIGRTGAGKSSILTALLRIVEPEGQVMIGGVDSQSIPLNVLRSHITVIPQSPDLFSGTLRYNLDPREEFSDSDIVSVLMNINTELGQCGLDTVVVEQGVNFSVGQRQLICLARSILNKNRIAILDEATANLDAETDLCIQRLIKEHLRNCTVITIAHRLQSVMDADRIVVMDSGRVVEFDEPQVLLSDPQSAFYSLMHPTGHGNCVDTIT